jgi:hypothetical protein
MVKELAIRALWHSAYAAAQAFPYSKYPLEVPSFAHGTSVG